MDKKKIISSLTVAGMLATAGATSVFADSTDPDTAKLGEYKKNYTTLAGKTVVPFVLQSDSDRVTGKDLKKALPGLQTSLEDTDVVKSGDVVRVNGQDRTILIYGDANQDGKVSLTDVQAALNHYRAIKTLEGAAFAAADLDNNGKISLVEVQKMLNVNRGLAEVKDLTVAPVAEKADEVIAKISNRTIARDGSYIEIKYDAKANGNKYTLYDNKDI